MAPTEKDSSVPLKQRSSDYYELHFTEASGLPPGTDTIDQVKNNPRQPRPPPDAIRTLPPLPPKSERKGRWIDSYLDKLDPTTEYDQIIRVCTFFRGSDFATAIGYAAVFVWLTATPGGANAIHGGKVTTRGHQRYYETQLFNLRWVFHGAGSPETKKYCEQINKVHTGIWNRVPGAFSFPWEAQNAIILLSYYETLMRRIVGADNEIHPKLKEAWPAWGERLTAHLKSEPQAGSVSFGCNYPRNWNELENFVEWFQEFDYSDQCTEEDRIKGYETAESFIDQFSELWFPRYVRLDQVDGHRNKMAPIEPRWMNGNDLELTIGKQAFEVCRTSNHAHLRPRSRPKEAEIGRSQSCARVVDQGCLPVGNELR